MHKVISISTFSVWIAYCVCLHLGLDYAWIFKHLTSVGLGSCCVYTWKFKYAYEVLSEIQENEEIVKNNIELNNKIID